MTETYCKKRQHESIEQENYKYVDMEKENINQEYMAPESNRRLRILLVLTGAMIVRDKIMADSERVQVECGIGAAASYIPSKACTGIRTGSGYPDPLSGPQ